MYPDWGLDWGGTLLRHGSLVFFFMEIEWEEVNHLA